MAAQQQPNMGAQLATQLNTNQSNIAIALYEVRGITNIFNR